VHDEANPVGEIEKDDLLVDSTATINTNKLLHLRRMASFRALRTEMTSPGFCRALTDLTVFASKSPKGVGYSRLLMGSSNRSFSLHGQVGVEARY
jgi:hypothetical protein